MSISTNSEPDSPFFLEWRGELGFTATAPSGKIKFDAGEQHGGQGAAISPLEAFLASAAACSAIDVVMILKKKRQAFDKYRVEITYERKLEGDYPHPITEITLKHILSGPSLDSNAVKSAVALSDEKYCTVIATLRAQPKVSSVYSIEG